MVYSDRLFVFEKEDSSRRDRHSVPGRLADNHETRVCCTRTSQSSVSIGSMATDSMSHIPFFVSHAVIE